MNKNILFGAAMILFCSFFALVSFKGKTKEQQLQEISAAVEAKISELRTLKVEECNARVLETATEQYNALLEAEAEAAKSKSKKRAIRSKKKTYTAPKAPVKVDPTPATPTPPPPPPPAEAAPTTDEGKAKSRMSGQPSQDDAKAKSRMSGEPSKDDAKAKSRMQGGGGN